MRHRPDGAKSGKTHGALVWLAEQAMAGQPHREYWWVAPILDQARIAYRRLKRAFPPALVVPHETGPLLTLANGARVVFKGGDHPDSLYGEDVWAAVVDEFTRLKEDAWHAVRSTLTATQGPIRLIGNVKGRKNWGYRLARMAEAGTDETMHYARITAWDAVKAGVLEQAEIEDARRHLPADVFQQFYLAEATDDEGNPFGLEHIAACVRDLSEQPAAVWGWDLAKSQDWTEGVALDEAGVVCRHVRWQKPWEETIRRITTYTGETPALVDSTGVGDPVLERLQRIEGGRYEGFKFSATSKQQLMEGLAVALQQRQIGIPDGVIRLQLEQFEYRFRPQGGVAYSAPEGLHDDAVCALALAVRHWLTQVQHRRGWHWLGDDDEPTPDAATVSREVAARVRQGGGVWFPTDGA